MKESMAELPKLVKDRLAAQPHAGQHPDPDLLSAFAEQRLTLTEKQSVLAHLSSCSECREVVALAQPELGQPAQVAAPARVQRLLWILAPVTIAIALAFVVLFVPRPEQSNGIRMARVETPAPPAERDQAAGAKPEAKAEQAALPGSPAGPAKSIQDKGASLRGALVKKTLAGDHPRSDNDAFAYATPTKNESGKEIAAFDLKSTPPVMPVAAPPPPPFVAGTSVVAQAQVQPEQSAAAQHGTAGSQAEAVSVTNKSGPAQLLARSSRSAAAKAAPAPEASYGLTSETANAKLELEPQQAEWRVREGALEHRTGVKTWERKLEQVENFALVNAREKEVWAATADNALWHSEDGGVVWRKLDAPWLTSQPIHALEMFLPGQITIITSDAQRWTSADNGKTWQRAR
jgi:hypothetical protein